MCQTHTLQKMSNISHLKDENRSLRFFWSPSSIILLMFFSIWKCIISYIQIIKPISNYSNITAWIPFICQSSTGGFEYFVSKKQKQKTKTKKQGRILTESWKSHLHHFKESWGKKPIWLANLSKLLNGFQGSLEGRWGMSQERIH